MKNNKSTQLAHTNHKKSLLNSYLATTVAFKDNKGGFTPDFSKKLNHKKRPKAAHHSHIKKTSPIKRNIRELGDLESLLPNSSASTKAVSQVKQLGSIQAMLLGQEQRRQLTELFTTSNQDTPAPHDVLFPKKHASAILDVKTDQDNAFSTASLDKETSERNLYLNISLFAIMLLGIGACIFGLNQLIQNTNINFASEGTAQKTIDPPQIMTFQGRLSNQNEQSITGSKQMRFTMYNTSGGNTPPPVGGEVLWSSNWCAITPTSTGIFTVNLGAGYGQGDDDINCGTTLGNIFAQNSNIWLQIEVDNEVLFPRQLIKSVPYALNSAALQGYEASSSATANTIPVINNDGNLVLNTLNSSLVNFGQLNLVSQTGDIYLLPGSGNVYIGDAQKNSNLYVSGEASISGALRLGSGEISHNEQGFTFRSLAGQSALADITFDTQGYLGLSTTTPEQKLTINRGSIAFTYLDAPEIGDLKLSEDVTDINALTRIAGPSQSLQFQERDLTGQLQAGEYRYAYTFVAADGTQTGLSPIATYNLEKNDKSVLLTNLSTSSHPSIVARNLYRSRAGEETLHFVKTISDNTSTTTFDNTADNDLQTMPNLSTTGIYRYKVTFVTTEGETNPSETSAPLQVTGDGRVIKIDNLPLARGGNVLLARKVYRSLADSDQYYLVATINDNTTQTIYDRLNDNELLTHEKMPLGGGIYANNQLALQFNQDGSISAGNINASGRLNTSHGNNQGLKLPTSAGKPIAKIGQQTGDIVYDSVNEILYIYNGSKFVAAGGNANSQESKQQILANNSHCTNGSCRITLDAEYAGAVLTGDGANNAGILTSNSEIVDEQYYFNFYQWQAEDPTILNDFDTTVNITIPNNFSAWQAQGLTLDFATESSNPLDNYVQADIYRSGTNLTLRKTNQVSQVANTWMSAATDQTPLTFSSEELSSLGFSAGDTLTLKIKTVSRANHQVKIGQINLNYTGSDATAGDSQPSLWRQLAGVIFPSTPTNDIVLGGDSTESAKIGFFNLDGISGTPTMYIRGNLLLDNQQKQNYLDLAAESSFNIRTLNANGTASERLTISADGNVGIGVTNPSEKLEIDGNIKANGTLQLSPISAVQAGACTAETKGKIYYDVEESIFFACQLDSDTRSTYIWTPLVNGDN